MADPPDRHHSGGSAARSAQPLRECDELRVQRGRRPALDPARRIRFIHLAGGTHVRASTGEERWLDDHLHDVPDPVYDCWRSSANPCRTRWMSCSSGTVRFRRSLSCSPSSIGRARRSPTDEHGGRRHESRFRVVPGAPLRRSVRPCSVPGGPSWRSGGRGIGRRRDRGRRRNRSRGTGACRQELRPQEATSDKASSPYRPALAAVWTVGRHIVQIQTEKSARGRLCVSPHEQERAQRARHLHQVHHASLAPSWLGRMLTQIREEVSFTNGRVIVRGKHGQRVGRPSALTTSSTTSRTCRSPLSRPRTTTAASATGSSRPSPTPSTLQRAVRVLLERRRLRVP